MRSDYTYIWKELHMAAGVDIQGERKNGAVVAPTLLILASGLLVLAGV